MTINDLDLTVFAIATSTLAFAPALTGTTFAFAVGAGVATSGGFSQFQHDKQMNAARIA